MVDECEITPEVISWGIGKKATDWTD